MFTLKKRGSDAPPPRFLSQSYEQPSYKRRASVGSSTPQPKRTLISTPSISPNRHTTNKTIENNDMRVLQLYIELLTPSQVNKRQLYKESWKGIAWQLRHQIWKMLIGQIPFDQTKKKESLNQSRADYISMKCKLLHNLSISEKLHQVQIQKDLVRSDKESPFLFNSRIQTMMENILLVWALRHPACGYVQGMNDLLVPFVYVYLLDYIYDNNMPSKLIDSLNDNIILDVEADSYYGLDVVLSRIQDNYTFEQQGIINKIEKMEKIVEIISPTLYNHLKDIGVMFIQFAFRWLNCCLLREFKLTTALRLWDSYLAVEDGTGFSELNLYCCVSLLTHFEKTLLTLDFSEALQFLQHLPTEDWNEENIQILVSQAYIFQKFKSY
ncbi:Rab-GAP TBC domain-containing protein [Entamoeba marina]